MRGTRNAWIAVGLVLATVAAYAPVFANGFVNYDDDLYILNNPHIQRGLGLDTIEWAFTTFRGANWFPLTWLSWAADFALFGADPAGFHLTSLVLHASAAVLLFLAFARLTGAPWCSAGVALVFALHPLHVESVAWAAARKDVLSGFFAMGALLAYERWVRRRRPAAYAALVACLALGLMAKPTLVAWPFVLLLLDVWPLRRGRTRQCPEGEAPTRLVVEKLPLFAMVAAVSAVAVWSQSHWGTVQDLGRLPLDVRLGNAVTSYGHYLVDAFWPSGLAVFYPHPGAQPAARVVVVGLALAAITVAAFAARRVRPDLWVGWLWFVGVLVPVIGLVQVGQAARADRYTYLPLIGLSLPVVFSLAGLAARGPRARAAVAAGAVIALLALGTATHRQVKLWRDSLTLFRHALAVTERNHVAHINVGAALLHEEEYERAARHLTQALRLAPASDTAAGLLGEVRLATGEPEPALALYRRALAREPDSVRWTEGLANAHFDLGQPLLAIEAYRRALERAPASARLHGNLGLALQQAGRTEEAVARFEEALRLNPNLADAHGNLGVALAAAGDGAAARRHLARAVELAPDQAIFRVHLGRALAAAGDPEGARRELARAVELAPGNGAFHSAYARVLADAGDLDGGLRHFRLATEAGERSVATWVGLAQAALAAGRSGEAVLAAREAAAAGGADVPAVLELLAEAEAAAGDPAAAAAAAEAGAAAAAGRGAEARARALREQAARYRERASGS